MDIWIFTETLSPEFFLDWCDQVNTVDNNKFRWRGCPGQHIGSDRSLIIKVYRKTTHPQTSTCSHHPLDDKLGVSHPPPPTPNPQAETVPARRWKAKKSRGKVEQEAEKQNIGIPDVSGVLEKLQETHHTSQFQTHKHPEAKKMFTLRTKTHTLPELCIICCPV